MSPLLRRYRRMLLLAVLIIAGVQAAVWISEAIEERRTPPPVKAARAFLDAFVYGDCERALALLSAASRANIEVEMAAQRRSAAAPRSCWAPSMRVFHGLRADKARLATSADGTAVVGVDRYEGDPKSYLVPGFWPTRYIVTSGEIEMVNEGGEWKVVVR